MEHESSRAFHSARVDEGGNEIEERAPASAAELPAWSAVHTFEMMPASGRNIDTLSPRKSPPTSRSVKYINTAVYIEKNAEDLCSHGGGTSLCSSSDIVPPLDLHSVCYSSPREGGYTFYYDNYGEPTKLKGSPSMAYENWLSAKRRIISDKVAKRKRDEEAKQREKEERKRLAEEKYQKWLEAKQQQERLKQNLKSKVGPQKRVEPKPPADARRKRIDEWERNKRLEEESRRNMKRLEREKREHDEEKRRQLAQVAWDKWILEAPNKPKPVPLNRGLFTLRGTISDIFINPNEWKSSDGL